VEGQKKEGSKKPDSGENDQGTKEKEVSRALSQERGRRKNQKKRTSNVWLAGSACLKFSAHKDENQEKKYTHIEGNKKKSMRKVMKNGTKKPHTPNPNPKQQKKFKGPGDIQHWEDRDWVTKGRGGGTKREGELGQQKNAGNKKKPNSKGGACKRFFRRQTSGHQKNSEETQTGMKHGAVAVRWGKSENNRSTKLKH